ncbi:MAG: D-alanine--D-alanine ligase [Thermodesulfovibrionales bacterium]|jgi:D-alanine-D-alanine ligase
MVTDKRIGVLMGGASAEREVSLKSGAAVFNALQSRRYDVVAVDVRNDICDVLKKEGIEIAFLTLHGGHGENGSVQGLLEVMGVPYTGSGVLASALAMDKELTKKIFLYHGIPVPPFRIIDRRSWCVREKPESRDSALLSIDLALPWVIKPVAEGSSIGVSIVKEKTSVMSALDHAFTFGDRALVEKYIEGKEVQVGILSDAVLGSVEVRPKVEFYTYEAKYTAGLTEYILPPEIEPGILEKAGEAALSAHQVLGCKGATRVDLIIDRYGKPFVLEVNTLPGMTETSLLPKIARLAGLDFPSLLEAILKETMAERKTA